MVVLPVSLAPEQKAAHLVAPSPALLKGLETLGHPSPVGESRRCVDDHQVHDLDIKMRVVVQCSRFKSNTCIHLDRLHVYLCVLDIHLPFSLVVFGGTLELLKVLSFDIVLLCEFL
jgi:hypothetical protein